MNLERQVMLRLDMSRIAVQSLRDGGRGQKLLDRTGIQERLLAHGFDLKKNIRIRENLINRTFIFEQTLTLKEAAIHALRRSQVRVAS